MTLPEIDDAICKLDREVCKGLLLLTPEQRIKPLAASASLTMQLREALGRLEKIGSCAKGAWRNIEDHESVWRISRESLKQIQALSQGDK